MAEGKKPGSTNDFSDRETARLDADRAKSLSERTTFIRGTAPRTAADEASDVRTAILSAETSKNLSDCETLVQGSAPRAQAKQEDGVSDAQTAILGKKASEKAPAVQDASTFIIAPKAPKAAPERQTQSHTKAQAPGTDQKTAILGQKSAQRSAPAAQAAPSVSSDGGTQQFGAVRQRPAPQDDQTPASPAASSPSRGTQSFGKQAPAQKSPAAPSQEAAPKSGGTQHFGEPAAKSASKAAAPGSGKAQGNQAALRLTEGMTVGHYELIRLLGKGGMGAVYLARDNRLGRRVAIKFLHTNDITQTRRFVLEARLTARCSHDNIVIIYEADQFMDAPYMVLELLRGTSLQDMLDARKRAPMPPARVAELIVPVLRALVCAHEAGIVHRDLKPDNIFVTRSGTVKVLDFGISKVLQEPSADSASKAGTAGERDDEADADDASLADNVRDLSEESASLTMAGAIMGTVPFMAPEQWRARPDIDAQADIWAMGIILHIMLAGRHPLIGLKGMQYSIVANYKVPMPSLAAAAPQLPPKLIALVDSCLQKNRAARIKTAAELLEGLEQFLPGREGLALSLDSCPYAGLSAFQESDAGRFFGRDREVAALTGMIRETPLVGVVGASGAGKSSIVRAGAVPALKRSGENWSAHFIRPGRSPLLSLADAIHPKAPQGKSPNSSEAASRAQSVAVLAKLLLSEPGRAGALMRSEAKSSNGSALIFVDQFEELFTQGIPKDERKAFMAALSSIADDASSPTRVVLSLRSDFLSRVSEDQLFLDQLTNGLFFLQAPDRHGMQAAIEEPARLMGYSFESDAIVEEMLDHLSATPGALPLLQFAASKLWENRDKSSKRLTVKSYREMGGIGGALATHADSILRDLTEEELQTARQVFLRLVSSERTRALVPVSELRELSKDPNAVDSLLSRLVSARLVVIQTSGGVPTAEIVHESLIGSWPTLKKWLDEAGEDVAFLEQLRNAARQWDNKGRTADLLWRGDLVDEARRFEKRSKSTLPEVQQAFLDRTFAQAARTARIKRFAITGGAAFLIAVTAVTLFLKFEADKQRVEADRQKEIALTAKAEADRQRDVAEERLREIEDKERARLAAQKQADESARIAEAEKQRAEEEARRAAEEAEKKRLAEEKARAEAEERARAEKQAALEAEQRQQAEERAALEAEKKRLAEERAKVEAEERARAEKQAALEAEKKREAERKAALEAEQREKAEKQAALEAQKKREAEEKARAEAKERERAEKQAALEAKKKREAQEAAERARKEKEAIDARNAARKARIGAIDDF